MAAHNFCRQRILAGGSDSKDGQTLEKASWGFVSPKFVDSVVRNRKSAFEIALTLKTAIIRPARCQLMGGCFVEVGSCANSPISLHHCFRGCR